MAVVKKFVSDLAPPRFTPSPGAFSSYLDAVRVRVDRWLDRELPAADEEPRTVHAAMRYAALQGGKRLRPALAILTCEAFGGEESQVLPAACALELVHAYSLVHDDLPCMDDAALRRGKPSVHKAYGEANAVLAGDGLLTEAFACVAKLRDRRIVGEVTAILALASGSRGMVGGQVEDLEAEGRSPSLELVRRIHARKTGALIAAAVEIGAVCAGVPDSKREAIRDFGRETGLAFQIADDILDATSDAATLGKAAGQDAAAKKMTYPACVGLENAKTEARLVAQRAQTKAAALGAKRPEGLISASQFVIERLS